MIIITAAFAITSGIFFLPFWATKSTTLCPSMFTGHRVSIASYSQLHVLGPTNLAAIKNRELQKPLAENIRMRYPDLFWDQWSRHMKLLFCVIISNHMKIFSNVDIPNHMKIFSCVNIPRHMKIFSYVNIPNHMKIFSYVNIPRHMKIFSYVNIPSHMKILFCLNISVGGKGRF